MIYEKGIEIKEKVGVLSIRIELGMCLTEVENAFQIFVGY